MFRSSFEEAHRIQKSIDHNKLIHSRIQEAQAQIQINLDNKNIEEATRKQIQDKIRDMQEAMQRGELTKQQMQRRQQEIRVLNRRLERGSISRKNAIIANRSIPRHTALINQSQQILDRMMEREVAATTFIEKIRARALNSIDKVQVAMRQHEVQAESRKYRDPLVDKQQQQAQNQAKQAQQKQNQDQQKQQKMNTDRQQQEMFNKLRQQIQQQQKMIEKMQRNQQKLMELAKQNGIEFAMVDGELKTVKIVKENEEQTVINEQKKEVKKEVKQQKKGIDMAEVFRMAEEKKRQEDLQKQKQKQNQHEL